MDELMTVNGVEYRIVRLLGRGKGGYSYLAQRGGEHFVLKAIHHEPCDYYQFGNKLESELRDYARLSELGIPMPKMLDVDVENERILKEYIDGDTISETVARGEDVGQYILQVKKMCDTLYPQGLNIDYYPTNFIPQGGVLYYVDYECNVYSDEWNFENWGIKYWKVEK